MLKHSKLSFQSQLYGNTILKQTFSRSPVDNLLKTFPMIQLETFCLYIFGWSSQQQCNANESRTIFEVCGGQSEQGFLDATGQWQIGADKRISGGTLAITHQVSAAEAQCEGASKIEDKAHTKASLFCCLRDVCPSLYSVWQLTVAPSQRHLRVTEVGFRNPSTMSLCSLLLNHLAGFVQSPQQHNINRYASLLFYHKYDQTSPQAPGVPWLVCTGV